MLGHLGFSYVGVIYMCMLLLPNLFWIKRQPQGYDPQHENPVLVFLERIGEALTICIVVLFEDFNLAPWSLWSWWLVASAVFMILYECWWYRYFTSDRKLVDFYRSLLGIPVAGATLPVLAFLLLGIYGKVIWLILSSILLGIGHIGIHMEHRKQLRHVTQKQQKNEG